MNREDLPAIEFGVDLDVLISERVKMYEDLYFKETGNRIILEKNDRDRVMIKACCLVEFQFKKLVEEKIKNNLLQYARDEYLDNIEPVDVPRFKPNYATTMMRLTVVTNSLERKIAKGKNVTPNGSIFFENKEEIVIPAGVKTVDVSFTCKLPGVIGNGYMPGQIATLVDAVPEVLSVTNISESKGGSEKEDDNAYRERKIAGNAGTSVGGPEDLYILLAKSYHVDVSDVKAITENPGEVTLIILLRNGVLPSTQFMDGLKKYMSPKNKRPMNDKIVIKAPKVVNYGISLTYYAEESKKAAIETAVDRFVTYQKSVIGRDINPTTLSTFLTDAGAKRVEITLPAYAVVGDLQVAVCNSKNVVYGGDIDAT